MATAAERLHLLYEVNRRLTSLTDLAELLRYATGRTRELFEAEGCAILLLDRERREFSFPVASQSASSRASAERLAEIRFPADRGIAGWVLSHGEAALVPDAQADSRFYTGVDRATQTTTRGILCAPLRAPSGNIGVVEVINAAASSLTQDDLEFLEALANDIAVAYEKALLYAHLHGEVITLQQVCRVGGSGLAAVGLLVSLWAVFAHLALALPLGEILMRPAMLVGLLAMLVGVALVGVGRGWIVGNAAAARVRQAHNR
ncbi:MAG TPA: GAF domain-containing protein [Candidatus Acidoferrales bacterium]|nr:GAF domain-containing protein [Candidatus Acidoferrales bacterium]